jgi:hypothetical protein
MTTRKGSPKSDGIDACAELARELNAAVKAVEPKHLQAIYALRRGNESPDSPHRIGGLPPGGGELRWPFKDGVPMVHLLTLDLAAMPELRERITKWAGIAPEEARTVSLFVHSPKHNDANMPHTDESAVVVGGERYASEPAPAAAGAQIWPEQRLTGIRIEVPAPLYIPGWNGGKKLKNALAKLSVRVLGGPDWIQDPQPGKGPFLLQFDERFVDVNLGDKGRMYVYADTAFWQCS